MLFKKPKTAAPPFPKVPDLPSLSGFLPEGRALADAVSAVTTSPDYVRLSRELEGWPLHSLISAHERAILHWLISETRARAVLEIGTAFAGTTLLLAASMLQAGRGVVYTIDPYATERTTETILGWPTALQEIVKFTRTFSTDIFIPTLETPPFDLVLIDGNHSYPSVMHDVLAAYEAVRPGGFVVLDNAEQVDVLDAARDFRRLTRHAEIVRVALAAHDPAAGYGFELDTSLEPMETDSAFVIVRKPAAIHVTRRALAFHLNRLRGGAIRRLEAVVLNPSDQPIGLRLSASLRCLSPVSTRAHDIGERFQTQVLPGLQEVSFEIASLKLPEVLEDDRVFAEVNLATAGELDELILQSLKINDFPVRPGRNFMKHLP